MRCIVIRCEKPEHQGTTNEAVWSCCAREEMFLVNAFVRAPLTHSPQKHHIGVILDFEISSIIRQDPVNLSQKLYHIIHQYVKYAEIINIVTRYPFHP